jgi:uncharacterized protein YneF (UPF0154 family)
MGPRSYESFAGSIFTLSDDPELIMWCLKWWPFAIAHHLNPFTTNYIWNPQGYSMAWATSVPTLAVLLAPLTLLASPEISFNLLALISLPLSALTCFWLLYYLTRRYFASLLAGCLFGFSSYQYAQLLGHPSLYVTFLVPLMILLFVLRLNERIGKKLFIILLSACVVLQFGISNEILTTFLVFGFIAFVLFYLLASTIQKRLLRSVVVELIIAGCIAMVILLPYFYFIVVGYKNVPKIINSPDIFSVNLLNYVIPTPVTRLLSSHFRLTTEHFTANYSEDGAYLGAPLLVLLAYYSVIYWKKAYVKALSVLLVVTIIASLGYRLDISGTQTSIYLPWAIVHFIPILRSALPDRLTLFVSLIAAIMVGMWLSYRSTKKVRLLKYSIVIIIICTLLPGSVYSWDAFGAPPIFQPQYVARYIPKHSNILLLPFGYTGNDMYYQYNTNMWFTQAGGYMGFTPPNYAELPIVQDAFFSDSPEANFKADLKAYTQSNRVSLIIYTPNIGVNLGRAIKTLNWPSKTEGGATIIQVPLQYQS